VSDLYACSGFRGNKKVEKHCFKHLSAVGHDKSWNVKKNSERLTVSRKDR